MGRRSEGGGGGAAGPGLGGGRRILDWGFPALRLPTSVFRLEELAGGADRLLDLSQRSAPVESESIQRADLGQRGDLVTAQAAAANELIERLEPRPCSMIDRGRPADVRGDRQRP